jgi:hypothetical protein
MKSPAPLPVFTRLHRLSPAFLAGITAVASTALAAAQTSSAAETSAAAAPADGTDRFTLRPSVMAGVSQWVLWGGGNIAAQVKFGRWVVEYSHGQSLHFNNLGGLGLTSAERDAGWTVDMPWTTGGGFGFQITPELHLMIEAKAHRYRVEDDVGNDLSYTTFTVGPGLFYDIYLYKGLFVQPNLRWWPTLASSYDGKRRLIADDGSEVRHERHDLFPFVNVNIGWTFSGI